MGLLDAGRLPARHAKENIRVIVHFPAGFAGEADGKFSGEFGKWNQAGEFYSTLARWTAGRRQSLPNDQLLTEQVRDGMCFVQLHLDPERKADPFAALPRVRTLHGLPGAAPGMKPKSRFICSASATVAKVPAGFSY